MPKKGVEMESGVVEGGRSPRGRKWARARVREGGRGGGKKRGSGGRSPDGENIHTSIHVRCVAWLCRCVLDLVAANAAHLLCPWWMSLSGAVQRVGWPAACERQAADRQTRTGSQGRYLLCREVLRSCPPAASCPPHAHGPHGPRASAPQRDAPGQSRAPGPRLSNQECHWSHAGQAQTTKGTVGGVTCGTVFQFPCTGHLWAARGWMLFQAGISSGLSGIRSFKLP